MTLPDLQACLDRLGVRLSLRLVVDAPAGVMTPEILAALVAHKPRLLALLTGVDDRADPTGPPVSEPIRSAGPPGLSDSEAVAAIDAAFADPAPARRSDRGPRDVRHGDRWLPADRQRIANLFPTAHRLVFVTPDRQRIAYVGGGGPRRSWQLGGSSTAVPPSPVPPDHGRWLCRKPHKLAEKSVLRRWITALGVIRPGRSPVGLCRREPPRAGLESVGEG
jgi:hypothetical protein